MQQLSVAVNSNKLNAIRCNVKNIKCDTNTFLRLLVGVLLLFSSLLFSAGVQARTLVLIHGYLGDAMTWRNSGFIQPLEMAGWKDGGIYRHSHWGMMVPRYLTIPGDVFYSVNLPSKANLRTQERILSGYLENLYLNRKEPITLVGHSAGGVVARLYLLNPGHVPIYGLVTIASPHLGTPLADIAHMAADSPLGIMAKMIGADAIRDSRGLYSDLKKDKPYSFLYWMNHQPHPTIYYASIIRRNNKPTRPNKFDYVVPPYSQNMNNIWALRGRSGLSIVTESHALNGKDGIIVANLVNAIPVRNTASKK